MNHADRRDRLRAELSKVDQQLLLVSEPKNIAYLCGFTGSAGWLLLTPDSHFLLTDGRYWDQVGRQSPQAELFKFTPQAHQSLAGALFVLLQEKGLEGTLAIETDGMALSVFRELEKVSKENETAFQESSGLVKALRECKDAEEVELLQKAADIADKALANALAEFGPGKTEFQLKAELEYQILCLGGQGTSFPTIVASGPNGSYPHAGASQRVVGEGELITIDFGAQFQGYCSDMTRTIWYGELSAEHRRLLAETRVAQELAVRAVRAGMATKDLDSVARTHLESVGLGGYFLHSLGHGVGLDVHESPGIRKTDETSLKIGQVITVEPGVYLAGETGCRVEDTVLVEEDGCRVINRFPKQPLDSPRPILA